jgi:hypothetical protein
MGLPATEMRSYVRQIGLATMIAAAIMCTCAVRSAADASLEYRVKAAFLYNFAKFVTWPARAFPAGDTPVVFCVAGADPFEDLLEATTQDRKVEGRRIEIRRLPADAPLAGCHLVFSSETDGTRVAHLLLRAAGDSVLTVGEADDFLLRGGMIRLLVDEGKVRFDISTRAADGAGLKLSSQLLKLARSVER